VKRLKIDTSILNSPDKDVVVQWLWSHNIDVAWITLEQTFDIEEGRVTYTRYRHTTRGELVFENLTTQAPKLERVTHHCTIGCAQYVPVDVLVRKLETYKVTESDDEPGSD
jgi:hypothetical protein